MIGGDTLRGDAATHSVFDDPLVVELRSGAPLDLPEGAPGSGKVWSPTWLGQRIEWTEPLNGLPTATISVAPHRGRMINLGTEIEPIYRDLADVLTDDTLVTVRTARGADEMVVFQGVVRGIRERVGPEGVAIECQCVHAAVVLDEGDTGHVYGQMQWSTGAIESDAPLVTGLHHPTHYDGDRMIAVFNPDGWRNCHAEPARISAQAGGGAAPPAVRTAVFVDPALRAVAQRWSYARALAYLLYWVRRVPGVRRAATATQDGLPVWEDRRIPRRWSIDVGGSSILIATNLYDVFGRIQAEEGLHPLDVDPEQLGSGPISRPWQRALFATPHNLAVDGMPWSRALLAVCARAGMHYCWRPATIAGEPGWMLEFSVPGAARVVDVGLPSPDFPVQQYSQAQIHERANVTRYAVTREDGAVRNELHAIGAPRLYEVTTELLPGWAMDARWDVDPEDAAAQEAALRYVGDAGDENDFAARYGFGGNANAVQSTAVVGRLWLLNTFGRAAGFGRPFGPWTTERYERVHNWAALDGTRLGEYEIGRDFLTGEALSPREMMAYRPRQLLPLLTGYDEAQPDRPRVEISYDCGLTWHWLAGDVQLAQRDWRVYVAAADLRVLTDPATRENYPRAAIRGLLRVRVTACVRGDWAVDLPRIASTASLARRRRVAFVAMRNTLLAESREPAMFPPPVGPPPPGGWPIVFNYGNSIFRDQVRDDAGLPRVYARRRLEAPNAARDAYSLLETRLDRVAFGGSITLAGLVLYREIEDDEGGEPQRFGYKPGDQLRAIAASDDPLDRREHDLRLAARDSDDGYATIVALQHVFGIGDPTSGRGAALETTLVLGDGADVTRGGA